MIAIVIAIAIVEGIVIVIVAVVQQCNNIVVIMTKKVLGFLILKLFYFLFIQFIYINIF